jgi:hypothetical protein
MFYGKINNQKRGPYVRVAIEGHGLLALLSLVGRRRAFLPATGECPSIPVNLTRSVALSLLYTPLCFAVRVPYLAAQTAAVVTPGTLVNASDAIGWAPRSRRSSAQPQSSSDPVRRRLLRPKKKARLCAELE